MRRMIVVLLLLHLHLPCRPSGPWPSMLRSSSSVIIRLDWFTLGFLCQIH